MSLLKNLTSDATIKGETDSVGSGGVVESGLYESTITMAYFEKSKGGALGMFLTAKTDSGNEIKQTLWMTSGTAKGGKNFYEKDGVKNFLPGYLAANSIALLACAKEVNALETEEKVVKVYSYEAKAEVPTKVECAVELIGQKVILGIIKQTVDKTKQGDDGEYHATGETRDENELDKVFRARDRMTTAEIRSGAETALFADTWADKWTNKTKNRANKSTGTAGVPRSSAGSQAATGSTKPTKSLFA